MKLLENIIHLTFYCITFLTIILSFQSCSLFKISADLGMQPLPKTELNARLNVRLFSADFVNITSAAVDSVINELNKLDSSSELYPYKDSLILRSILLKKNFSWAAVDASLTSIPKGALLNMWVVVNGADYFIARKKSPSSSSPLNEYLGMYTSIVQQSTHKMKIKYEHLTKSFLHGSEYKIMSSFVDSVLNASNFNKDYSYRDYTYDYIKYANLPDTSYIKTVGSIPEVIADLNDKLSGYTNNYTNQLAWGTDVLKYKFNAKLNDSVYKQKLDSLNFSLEQLRIAFKQAPTKVDSLMAIVDVRLNALLKDLNDNVNNTIDNAFSLMNIQRDSLQNYISLERKAAFEQGKSVIDDSIVQLRIQITKLIKNLLIYFILFVFLLLGIPFYFGYRIGMAKKKENNN